MIQYKSARHDIQISTIRCTVRYIQYTNRYDKIYEAVQYNIQISAIRYTNKCDAIYEFLKF